MNGFDRMIASLPEGEPAANVPPDEPGECEVHREPKVRFLKYRIRETGAERWSPWHCGTCKAEADQAAIDTQRAHETRVENARRIANSGLRGRFLDCTFDNFEAKTADQRQALETVWDYFAKPDGFMWLVGPVGTGKTHLAAAGVRYACEIIGSQAVMLSVRQLIRDLRATWEKDAEHTESQRIEYFGTVPLLVLDEVGVGFGSDAELTQLFDVLDWRYTEKRPTVMLSNLAPSGIKAAIGERIYDRMREGAQLLRFEWKSHRVAGK